jgi:putative protease
VVKTYREAIDAYYRDPEGYVFQKEWLEEVSKVSDREYTTGFYFSKPGSEAHNYVTTKLPRKYDFVGLVLDYDSEKKMALVEQRNRFAVGDVLEVFGPHTAPQAVEVKTMYDTTGQTVDSAPHPQQQLYLKVDFPLEPFAMLRTKK